MMVEFLFLIMAVVSGALLITGSAIVAERRGYSLVFVAVGVIGGALLYSVGLTYIFRGLVQ